MGNERAKRAGFYVEMLQFAMSDSQAVLFGWAEAASSDDPASLEIAELLKDQAERLGATEQEFTNALEAMKVTKEIFKNDGVAQSH